MPLTLTWRDATALPVAGEMLRPDTLAGLGELEVARLMTRVGRRPVELGELFRVEGACPEGELRLAGNLRGVAGIGRGMGSGSILVDGDAGPLLGCEMAGGSIEVRGAAGGWAAAEMRNGMVLIRENAGDCLAAALPGSRLGMRDGRVIVLGDAGADAGLRMRRGLIAIGGDAGDDLGRAMVAGSIFVLGAVGARPGSGMRRGTLALFGASEDRIPPTFAPAGRYRPPFLTIYLKALAEHGLRMGEAAFQVAPARYNGDLAEGGQGEILLAG